MVYIIWVQSLEEQLTTLADKDIHFKFNYRSN